MKHKKLHKFLVCVLAVILALSTTSVVSFAAIWSGGASTVIPSVTNDGFYLIQSAEDLAWFANQVNADAGNATMKARLTTDIYLNDIETKENLKYWTPIGNYSNGGRVFSGIFDGKGFTIYGLLVSSTSDYQGLFGYIDNGQVRNLNITTSYVYGGSRVGTVAGYSNNSSSITQVVVDDGHVYGTDDVGGITGYLVGSGNISYCAYSGEVNATGHRVGGITGCAFSECTISQSFNKATVATTGKFVGGIAGTNSGSFIISCYNRGNVSGDLRVAGIVGNNVGDIASCYNASEVTSISEPAGLTGAIAAFYYTAKITDCYYDATLFPGKEDNGIPMESDEMKRHSFVATLNAAAGNFYSDYLQKNNGYPIMSWQADQNLWDGTVLQPKMSNDGKYYLINNGRELAWFAGLVNGTLEGVEQDTSANAMLMNSIVLNIGNLGDDSNVWTPIGSDNGYEYTGEFAGNGFSIRGMYIPSGDVVGLFGATSATALISDITITESIINGSYAVGPVVGINYGKLQGVKVIYTEINGEENVGGIVGENGGDIVASSSIYSEVTGVSKVGGIVGVTIVDAVVETCCSNNTVTGEDAVGGIVGESECDVSRSFNAGNVTATNTYAGGIAGRISNMSTVSNCYNTGTVSASSRAGGIAGQIRQQSTISCTYSIGEIVGIDGSTTDINAILGDLTNGTVEYSYYDKEKISATDSRATALKTSKMTGANAMNNLDGFSHEYWIPTPDTEFFVNYPQLDTFVSSADYDLYDISAQSVAYLKDGLVCKVIGNNETSYYETLTEAATKIGTGTGTIEIMADLKNVGTEIVIEGNVTLIPTNDSISITRTKHYFGQVFTVKDGAVLNFGADDAQYAVLNINGNNVVDIMNQTFASSLITVEKGGTFNCYDVITTNNTALNGGFVYNEGTVNFYGGSITAGTAIQYGGVAYNKGTMNVYAVEMANNNAKLAGGAIFNAGGTLNIETGADIHNNTSGEGGAVYAGGGTTNLRGGSIYLNSASYGGAFSVMGNGKLMVYDGSVYDNAATVSGNAIYVGATLSFYSGAFIDASNDIFLPTGETITMAAKSVYASSIATITPESYTEGLRVVNGDYTAMNANLCAITPQEETAWHINSSGKLTTNEIKYVLTASFFKSDDVPYTSIEEAMADIGENPAIITLLDDIVLTETLIIKSDITIESDGIAHTISVPAGFEGPMFKVIDGAALSLGTHVDEYTTDVLYVNGANVTADAVIEVVDGKVEIYSGTVVFGADNIESAIKSTGTIEMYGGKVTENSTNVGAIYIADGSFDFFAGTIFDNSNVGVYANGTLNIYDGAGVDESNIVYLTDGNVINVQRPDPIYDEEGNEIEQEYVIPDLIASVDFERYYVDTSIISSSDDDLSKYTGKFVIKDPTYTLDEMNILRADDFAFKENATAAKNDKFVYGLSVNSYTVRGLLLQFTNTNIVLADKEGNSKGDNDKVGSGDTIMLLDSSGNAYREISVVIYGDVDGDGDVNANDSFVTKMYIYGWYTREQFTSAQLEAMDVNHDGTITEEDALIMEDMGIFEGDIEQNPSA